MSSNTNTMSNNTNTMSNNNTSNTNHVIKVVPQKKNIKTNKYQKSTSISKNDSLNQLRKSNVFRDLDDAFDYFDDDY